MWIEVDMDTPKGWKAPKVDLKVLESAGEY